MGQIRLLSITAKNFLTIKGPMQYGLSNKGLVGVFGLNGVGKSTLFTETLNYGLFGVSERYGKSRDQIINRFVGKDCHVGVKLMVDDLLVEVDTYRKDSKHRDNVYLKLDGVDKRGNNNDQTWDKIIKLLDMDYLAFTNSVIFGQAISQYFSGLSDASQKEVVERLLGITWLPIAQKLAKTDNSDCYNKFIEAENGYNDKKFRADKIKDEIEQYKLRYAEFEKQKEQKIKELKTQYEKTIPTIELAMQIEVHESKLELERDLFNAADLLIREVENKILTYDVEISRLEKDAKKIENILKSLDKAKIGDFCEFCGQTITAGSEKLYREHLFTDKIANAHYYLQLTEEKIILDNERIAGEKERKAMDLKIRELNRTIVGLQRELSELKLKNAVIEERNNSITQKIEEIKTSTNAYEEIIGKKVVEVKEIETEMLIDKTSVINLKEELNYHAFWEEAFSNRGMKSFIIESVIPQMNTFSRIYSQALGGKFDISFSAQHPLKSGELREKFFIDVVNKIGSKNYEGNSSGERRAIDSIIMFVLGDLCASRSNKRFSILILDDVFEKLDEEICDSIIRVLRMMVSENTEGLPRRESIFVLTHLEYFKSKFQNKIFVDRQNGETIYREE